MTEQRPPDGYGRPSRAGKKILERRRPHPIQPCAGAGTQNDRPKVPNHEKITSGSSGWVYAAGIGSGMLLGTLLGSRDLVGVSCDRYGRGIDSFRSNLIGGQAKCPYCMQTENLHFRENCPQNQVFGNRIDPAHHVGTFIFNKGNTSVFYCPWLLEAAGASVRLAHHQLQSALTLSLIAFRE